MEDDEGIYPPYFQVHIDGSGTTQKAQAEFRFTGTTSPLEFDIPLLPALQGKCFTQKFIIMCNDTEHISSVNYYLAPEWNVHSHVHSQHMFVLVVFPWQIAMGIKTTGHGVTWGHSVGCTSRILTAHME